MLKTRTAKEIQARIDDLRLQQMTSPYSPSRFAMLHCRIAELEWALGKDSA